MTRIAAAVCFPQVAFSGTTKSKPSSNYFTANHERLLGPNYPSTIRIAKDLLKASNSNSNAQKLHLFGKIVDKKFKPLKDLRFEIWHADEWGVYNYQRKDKPMDPRAVFANSGGFDHLNYKPNEGYHGAQYTNKKGEFEIVTIMPGCYPNVKDSSNLEEVSDWVLPSHMHLRVLREKNDSEPLLSSEIIFAPSSLDRYNEEQLRNKILISLLKDEITLQEAFKQYQKEQKVAEPDREGKPYKNLSLPGNETGSKGVTELLHCWHRHIGEARSTKDFWISNFILEPTQLHCRNYRFDIRIDV